MVAVEVRSPLDSWQEVKSLATKLDEEPITKVNDPGLRPISGGTGEGENSTPCADCNSVHLPRRIVCCVDGTWMGSDGAAGRERGTASNIFRIWSSVKKGVVQDENGKRWLQVKKYFKGVGADVGFVAWIHAGIMGSGCENLIFKVYKFCAFNCCPSQDEIYFFGYSRGAYVVRAVAALFHHIGTLDPKSDNFDKLYEDSIGIYRRIRGNIHYHKNEVYHHRITNSLAAAPIKFIGVIDTVKAFNDVELYDITQTPNVTHVRHALAILENRNSFSPEKYLDVGGLLTTLTLSSSTVSDLQAPTPQTCLEAWFLGTHGDLGGSLLQDGLSLWPLQFILSEAETSGLVLGFESIAGLDIQNPVEYSMPTEEGSDPNIPRIYQSIPYKNGFTVKMWDLADTFKIPGFEQSVNVAKWLLPERYGERQITGLDDGSHRNGTIIHPSVYYLDDHTPLGLLHINLLKDRHRIRNYWRTNITIPYGELFWNRSFRQKIDLTLQNPRVLVCGSHGSSKSTMINVVAGENIAEVNSTLNSTDHDIYTELQANNVEFRFHDSRGWDNGSETPFITVGKFLEHCRSRPVFAEQLHCIWYCMEASQSRINTTDKRFFREVDAKGVRIILVFTKCDRLLGDCHSEAIEEYENDNNCIGSLDHYSVPGDIRLKIIRRQEEIYEAKKCAIARGVMAEINQEVPYVFVSQRRVAPHILEVSKLMSLTRDSRSSPALRKIHNQAIKSHLTSIFPEVCEKAAQLKPKKDYKVKSPRKTREGIVTKIRAAAESFMLSSFKLQLSEGTEFKNLAELYTAVDSKRMSGIEELWTSFSFQTKEIIGSSTVGYVALATTYLESFSPMLLAVTLAGETATAIAKTFYCHKSILVELALLILVHDRMIWFGTKNITPEMAARAWITVLKSTPDIEDKVHKDLSVFSSDNWKALLLGVVENFKHVSDDEDVDILPERRVLDGPKV